MSANYAFFAFQLVAFIILVALMHDLYRKLRRDDARPSTGPDPAQMRAGVDEMVAELRRAADRINADIVARAGTLQKLVDEADQKLRQLDAAMARSEAGRQPAARAPRPAPPPRVAPPTAASVAPRQPEAASFAAEPALARAAAAPVSAPANSGRRPAEPPSRPAPPPASPARDDEPWPGAPVSEPTRTMPRVAPAAGAAGSAYRQAARATAAPPSQAAGAEAAARRAREDDFMELGLDDAGKFQTVRRLADQGLSAAEIARQTRLGCEEVELIM
jgi:hypothetical protein